jgi:hypothetical protein
VFPLLPREKVPFRDTQGFKEATRNPELVRKAWAKHPDANIGLWPGPSGLVAIDVDGPKGEALAREFGLLREPTLVCVSGRDDGGRHLYFRAPGFVVGNVKLGHGLRPVPESEPYLLFRSQDGYVVLPPSIHPTGRRYRWAGTAGEIGELPPEVLAQLRAHSDPQAPSLPAISGHDMPEGGRNNELTRVAGKLLTKHTIAEATDLLWSYNVAHCKPPLARREVEAIIASLSKREVRKPSRLTETDNVLSVEGGPGLPGPELPEPGELAGGQVTAALDRGRLDLSAAPRWQWPDLHELAGVMIPGDLVVVGALTGNGKTSFLLSQLDWNAQHRIPTLYLPLEVDPADVRRRWAAWKLGLDYTHVARNDWGKLPDGAQESHEEMLAEQGKNLRVQFPPDRRITLSKLAQWVRWGVETIGARAVFIDHFHRMDLGASMNYRIQITDTVRAVKDLGREHGLCMIAAAQLNQDGDQLDRYFPPVLRRLKESAGIGEEADSVLMLSRRLRQLLTAKELRMVRAGHRSERDFEEPSTMVVTCRKHRLDDEARDRGVRLHVEMGRVLSSAPGYREHGDDPR